MECKLEIRRLCKYLTHVQAVQYSSLSTSASLAHRVFPAMLAIDARHICDRAASVYDEAEGASWGPQAEGCEEIPGWEKPNIKQGWINPCKRSMHTFASEQCLFL